jgi:CRISPR/Cas system CSM-associated protein Csm4 (group 5 of RAMP superfamily)
MKKEDLKKIIFEEAIYVKNLIEEKKKIEKKLKNLKHEAPHNESEIEETTGKGQGVNRMASHKGEIGKKL